MEPPPTPYTPPIMPTVNAKPSSPLVEKKWVTFLKSKLVFFRASDTLSTRSSKLQYFSCPSRSFGPRVFDKLKSHEQKDNPDKKFETLGVRQKLILI